MAYEAGGAVTGPAQMVDTIKTRLQTDGWTINFHDNTTTPGVSILIVQKTIDSVARYYSLYGTDSGGYIDLYMATGYVPGDAYNAQPQTTAYCRMGSLDDASSFKGYYFFTGDNYSHWVVETLSNRFCHGGIGVVEKCGTYTGGEYVYGTGYNHNSSYIDNPTSNYHTYPLDSYANDRTGGNSIIRCAIDGFVPGWATMSNNSAYSLRARGQTRNGALYDTARSRTPNIFNGQSVLFPQDIFVRRISGLWAPCGTVSDMRVCNMTDINAAQQITLGSDDWILFPIIQKYVGVDLPSSGIYGLAYRKNP